MAGDGGEEVELASRRMPSVLRAVFVYSTEDHPWEQARVEIQSARYVPGAIGELCFRLEAQAVDHKETCTLRSLSHNCVRTCFTLQLYETTRERNY
jgi:hypothetical protein